MRTKFFRFLAHLLFRGRHFNNSHLKRAARGVHGKKVLEIGSGRLVKGIYRYSARRFFDGSNKFVQSDIEPDFGHRTVDVTKMAFDREYDVILCVNVLEHVFEFSRAFSNIHRALKPNGLALIGVPGFYPLHDEPNDYWRYTEHSLRRLMSDYTQVRLWHSGIRAYPFAYFVEAVK